MATVRLTTCQTIVRWWINQRRMIDGVEQPVLAAGQRADNIADLPDALTSERACDRSYALVMPIQPYSWLDGSAWWEMGSTEVRDHEQIRAARAEQETAKTKQCVS